MAKWGVPIQVLCIATAIGTGAVDAMAVTYYVDNSSMSANDSNAGTSEVGAWRTISRVNAQSLQPGDNVLFKAGTSYTGHVYIRSSGTQAQPITIGRYGTGAAPIIRNPGTWTTGITIDANWVRVSGLLLRDIHEDGIRIARGRQYNVVERCEFVNAGIGVLVLGPNNIVRHNYAHDLTMIWNTVGGDDDYGAVGFWIEAPNNEVSYNRCIRCKAPSFDYGMDGGLVEIYGNGDNVSVHHNWAQDSNSFFEVSKGSAKNITIAYNVSINNEGYFGGVHGESLMQNFRVENNTVVETQHATSSLIWGVPNQANFIFRNNIVMVSQVKSIFARPVTRANNLYFFTGGQGQIVAGSTALASGEQLGNPLFVDQPGFNFRLQPTSPAINQGLMLGYTRDYDQTAVPHGHAPDLGAFEFTGQASNQPPVAPAGLRVF